MSDNNNTQERQEEILKKHIRNVGGLHNLTDWHKGFIYKAMEEYAKQFSSTPSPVYGKDLEEMAKEYPGSHYQRLFNMINEVGKNPLQSQMDDIIQIVKEDFK